ncbi:DciA family protein [Streptomyces nigra]|uniref:DciA family protein n=1 Tax=Streptomyces nigra TaxID=1827580 RepID=UPI0036B36726
MTDTTTTPQPSGIDLARVALLAAKEHARRTGGTTESRTLRPRSRRGARQASDGRDPRGLGAVIQGLITDRAWEAPTVGGSAVDEWPEIAGPRLSGHVRAVKFRAATGELEVQVESPAWFTQLRLEKPALLARFAEALGTGIVKDIVRSQPGTAAGDLTSERPPARSRPQQRGTASLRDLVQHADPSHPVDAGRRDGPSAGAHQQEVTTSVNRTFDPDQPEPDPAALTHARALLRARRERAERKRREAGLHTEGEARD